MSSHQFFAILGILLLLTVTNSLSFLNQDTRQYRSCSEAPAQQSGIYTISLGNELTPFQAYCEQEKYGGGWLVFQNRYDGSVSFNRSWEQYRLGFGDLQREFWLGLEKIHQITATKEHDLLIVIKNFTDFSAHEIYAGFQVNNEATNYTLRLSNVEYSYHGTAQNSFWGYRNEQFSTYDRINDKSILDCSILAGSGYWHYDCGTGRDRSNLNGEYSKTVLGGYRGFWWGAFGGQNFPLRKSKMMIKVHETIN